MGVDLPAGVSALSSPLTTSRGTPFTSAQRARFQAGEGDSFILRLSGVTPGQLDTDT